MYAFPHKLSEPLSNQNPQPIPSHSHSQSRYPSSDSFNPVLIPMYQAQTQRFNLIALYQTTQPTLPAIHSITNLSYQTLNPSLNPNPSCNSTNPVIQSHFPYLNTKHSSPIPISQILASNPIYTTPK
jgi:hypothetical protein